MSTTNEATFTLTHTDDDGTKTSLPVRVRSNGNSLEIAPAGYGQCAAVDGCGSPVVLDLLADRLRVYVFADINSEEPTDAINLEGARESEREEHRCPHGVDVNEDFCIDCANAAANRLTNPGGE